MILEIMIALVAILLTTAFMYRRRRGTCPYQHTYVVITGCDSGFGRLAAERFDSLGMHVFAGCLLEKSILELKERCSDNIVPILVDVTKQDDIKKLLIQVHENLPDGKGLTGLLNNAGIAGALGLTESLGSDQYLSTFRVNFFGMVDVTKALLPLLRKGKGRIINTSSIGGKVCAPFIAPYYATKHAIESYSDTLRRELYYDDISVHIIEPGRFQTSILSSSKIKEQSIECFQNMPPESKEFYGIDMLNPFIQNIVNRKADTNLDKVVDAYHHALTSPYPMIRYKVGIHPRVLIPMSNYAPEWFMDALICSQYPDPCGANKP